MTGEQFPSKKMLLDYCYRVYEGSGRVNFFYQTHLLEFL
jgi:hypothetical protein